MTDWRCSGVWSQYLEISTCAIRPGPSAFDRQRRHRRLHDGLAGPAAQLRAQVADHLEAGRDIFEHFALVLADAAEGGAAAPRAGARAAALGPGGGGGGGLWGGGGGGGAGG